MRSPRLLFAFSLLSVACGQTDPGSTAGSGGTGAAAGDPGIGTGGGAIDHTGDLLIDDFTDADGTNELGTDWYAYDDADANGASTIAGADGSDHLVVLDGYQASPSLSAAYQLAKGDYEWDPFVGVGFNVPTSAALGDYDGISYVYKGAAHTLRFESTNITDYDYYVWNVPASGTWSAVTISFTQLAQAGYGTPVEWAPELVKNINWHVVDEDGTTGSLELDDVWLEGEVIVNRGPMNLIVHEADPPEKTVLESIDIPGALQDKAMTQLNRGYNLTNWLEAGRFDGTFAFDETYLGHLADNGYLGIRLPIDLDLYVNDESGTGDAVVLDIDDDLWTVLDSFEQWTRDSGLSLTIDYHQYDSSFDFDDTAGVDRAVALWKAVAQRYSANARDDLYFELLNEPELSTGSDNVLDAASWTPVAQRMIESIREVDTTHTIIFGDVNWYGIQELSEREPFADANIVYSFHSYEPFIFTHQGADWAQMSTTHDIPFPYDPARWSEYSSDLGLTSAQPNWIWDQFRNYYKNGTVEALYNRVAVAKAWGVEHGVPVICNEFGTYDRKSQLADRVAYYTALIDAFEELEIPWQSWFMIMNEDGEIIPEYIEAFGLDQ